MEQFTRKTKVRSETRKSRVSNGISASGEPSVASRSTPVEAINAAVTELRWQNFREVFLSTPMARIELIRNRVAAADFKRFATELASQERVCHMLAIATASVNRKASRDETLTLDESARIIGLAKIIGQVEAMVAESGDPSEAAGFNARKWLMSWLGQPIAALGGKRPAGFMDTIEGQQMISKLIAMMQSGAYA